KTDDVIVTRTDLGIHAAGRELRGDIGSVQLRGAYHDLRLDQNAIEIHFDAIARVPLAIGMQAERVEGDRQQIGGLDVGRKIKVVAQIIVTARERAFDG